MIIMKEHNIKLSIIVPVYNVKDYLNDCLRSLAEQSIQNVEFIIIDDGSTDGSSEICDQWSVRDNRFKVIHQENKGTLLARKIGIEQSIGEKIIFLDGDDILAQNAIHDIFELINKCNADIIQFSSKPFNCININQYRKFKKYLKTNNKKIYKNTNIAKEIFKENTIIWNLWNKIYSSHILKQSNCFIYNYKCISATDLFHSFFISYYAKSLCSYKTRPLYLYRLNTGISTKKQSLNTFRNHLQHIKTISYLKLFLQQVNASNEWYEYLDIVKKYLYSTLVYNLSTLPRKDFPEAFKFFYEKYNVIEALPLFEKYFIERQNELADAYINLHKNRYSFSITRSESTKTVGVFYRRYYNGGIERVISIHILLFIKLGFRIVLFTEEINKEYEYFLPESVIRVQLPVSYTQERADVFLSAIKKYNISTICHHATSSLLLIFDMIFLHKIGIYTVLIAHEMTDFSIAQNIKYSFDRTTVYKLADLVVTLSLSEENFYQQCGINARYVPNPMLHINKLDILPISQRKATVLWLGRLENKQKNYKDALKIFKIIKKKNKNVTCYLVGSGGLKDYIYVKLYIRFFNLKGKIIHIPYSKDVERFYKKASVHLVTSSFETFPMVIAEGKMYGLPLVTYELLNVELLKDGKGFVCIERHNILEAAEAVLNILNDKKYADKLSKEAHESLEPFLHFNQAQTWSEILNNPSKQYTKVTENNANNMSLFWRDLLSMYHEGLASRPTARQQIKLTLKAIIALLLPSGTQRRSFVVKIYRFIKVYLKTRYSIVVNYLYSHIKQ